MPVICRYLDEPPSITGSQRSPIARHAVITRGGDAVGRPGLTTEGRFLAAVVACGDRAVLSHASAAMLWGQAAAR
jgi:hypothetical protein